MVQDQDLEAWLFHIIAVRIDISYLITIIILCLFIGVSDERSKMV